MPVKGGTRDHEMSWLLFEAADSRMMLVKKTKQPKCPKRKPPRNPPAKIKPPSASVTTIPPSNNQQQLSPNPVPVQTAPVPTFDPPPPYPYSTGPPKDVLPRQVAPSGAPPTLPPRPPKIPLLPAPQASTPALARNGLRPLERILNEASYSETSKDLANSPANLPSLEIEPFEDRSGQLISARELEHLISSKLDAVLTSIDGEAFSGNESELGKSSKRTTNDALLTLSRYLRTSTSRPSWRVGFCKPSSLIQRQQSYHVKYHRHQLLQEGKSLCEF